jgi:threonine/homoserine/homoserine lactone efflux protein
VPSTGRLLAFAVAAFVIIVIPGPSVIFIVGRALSHGRRAALITVIGNTVGEYSQVVAIAFGVAALIERSVALFSILKLVGAAYLVVLGIRTYLSRRSLEASLANASEPPSGPHLLIQGIFVGATNPKTVVFLAAILPQFIERSLGHVSEQILLLGLIFSAIALLSDSAWGLSAGTVRTWFERSPRRLRIVGGAGGLSVAAVGIALAVTGRKD